MSLKIAPLNEKRSIYEIFRSCRLCGAGGGYKMPIIQNVVDLEDDDVELCQKIKECVQIEVAMDDKMPPLICELCIDKVNDFYTFQTLCKNTNNQTRMRLGLPPQNRSSSPVEESILGVTEALCEHEPSDSEAVASRSTIKPAKTKPQPKSKKVTVKVEKEQTPPIKQKPRRSSPPPPKQQEPPRKEARPFKDRRESSRPLREPSYGNVRTSKPLNSGGTKSRIRFERSSSSSPPPIRITRTKTSEELFDELTWDASSSNLSCRASSPVEVEREKKPASRPGPRSKQAASQSPKGNSKSQATKETKVVREKAPATPPQAIQTSPKIVSSKSNAKKEKVEEEKPKTAKKRISELESLKASVPAKKLKPTPPKQKERKDSPKAAPKALATPPEPVTCDICSEKFISNTAKLNHARTHVVSFTEPRLSCNACEDWFSTYEEAAAHHKWHRTGPNPYTCSVCTFDYETFNEYNVHIEKYSCRKLYEEPDVQCLMCWNDFPTQTSLRNHKCLGEAGRPGGKCSKCGKMYALLKNLITHESNCTKQRRANIDPEILYKIKPTQILVSRCDKLLEKRIGLRYDVANVPSDYGIDPNCYYPYLTKRALKKIKIEKTPFEGMVSITDDIRKQFEDHENADFQMDEDELDFGVANPGKIKKLSQLCLKAISNRENFSKSLKRKKVKSEAAFDDLLNDDQPAFSQSYNFDSLIDSLDKNDDSGEESVIKGFGLSRTDQVQSKDKNLDGSKSEDESISDDIFKSNDVLKSDDPSKGKDEKSPKKDNLFDIESILKSDSGSNTIDNENKSTTEPIDIDTTHKSENDLNINDKDESKVNNEFGFKSLGNNEMFPVKDSSKLDDLNRNDVTSRETNKTNGLYENNEKVDDSINGFDNSSHKSQNDDSPINKSVVDSKMIDEKIDSVSNEESNGVSEKADISDFFNENLDKVNEFSENVED